MNVQEMKERKSVITLYLPNSTLDEIDGIIARHRKRLNKQQVLRQIIDTGMYVEKRLGTVESWTSQDMENLKENLESGELVDWVAALDARKFETFANIFEDERKARTKSISK